MAKFKSINFDIDKLGLVKKADYEQENVDFREDNQTDANAKIRNIFFDDLESGVRHLNIFQSALNHIMRPGATRELRDEIYQKVCQDGAVYEDIMNAYIRRAHYDNTYISTQKCWSTDGELQEYLKCLHENGINEFLFNPTGGNAFNYANTIENLGWTAVGIEPQFECFAGENEVVEDILSGIVFAYSGFDEED